MESVPSTACHTQHRDFRLEAEIPLVWKRCYLVKRCVPVSPWSSLLDMGFVMVPSRESGLLHEEVAFQAPSGPRQQQLQMTGISLFEPGNLGMLKLKVARTKSFIFEIWLNHFVLFQPFQA